MDNISKKLGAIALGGTCIAGLGLADSSAMAASSIDTWNIYYGHLHNHTTYSDGSGSADQAYTSARNAGLDFFSVADHAEQVSSTEYSNTKTVANNHNQDGVFTAFWGFEWSSGTHGHVTITNADDICRSSESATNTFEELVSWLDSREAVAFFNHPGRESNAFGHYDGTVTDKFVGMELWNKTADFDTYYYNDGFHSGDGNKGHYDEALLRNWKIGAAGAEDNHGTNWGYQVEYRMAILADNLTRTDLYNAMKTRRFFSTEDRNIGLYFDMDGQVMGSETGAGTNSVTIKANDGNGETVTKVELLKNGVVINTWYPNDSQPYITDTVTSVAGDYFYCRIQQADTDQAISSPVFITSAPPVVVAPTVINNPATDITSDSATLNGTITDTGNEDPEVIIYWGDNDGGASPTNWDHADSLGYLSSAFNMGVINLQDDTTYYYRSYAVNSAGDDWADITESFTTQVAGNTAPTFTIDPINEADADQDVAYTGSIAGTATDADSDPLTYSKVSGPAWLSVAANGALSGTPASTDVGANSWTVQVDDGNGGIDTATLNITVAAAPGNWTQLLYDDFESGWGNWNDGGSDSKRYSGGTRAHQGTYALNLQDNTSTSVATTDNLSLSGYSAIKVDFWYYPYSMDKSNEDFWLQISTDGGNTYTTVEEWNKGDEFENGSFYQDSVTITGYTLTDQTRIRFRCDASGNADDVYIDEIEVSVQ